jgi:hypothetical protein
MPLGPGWRTPTSGGNVPKPSDRDAEYQARLEELDRAEDCLAVLGGFVQTANNSLYYQQPLPNSIKGQLLGALVDAVPVMEMLSGSNSLPLMDLLSRLRGAPVQSTAQVRAFADLVSTTESITYESLLPLVNGVLLPLELALKRFRRRHRLAAETGRQVLTVRLTDPSPAEDARDAQPKP